MFSTIKSISILIPCFNEVETLETILSEVASSDTLGLEKEIIVVDDGSCDGSKEVIINSPHIDKYIINDVNQGKGHSIKKALEKCRGDLILIQDADLEYSSKDYPRIIQPILEGRGNIVYGNRASANLKKNFFTYFASRLFTKMVNFLYRSNLSDMNTCYKLFRKEVLISLSLKANRFGFCSEVTTKALLSHEKIVEVEVGYNPRNKKQGKKIRVWDGLPVLFHIFYNRLFFKSKIFTAENRDEI
jgi:glycosyltransferase involved in cell wall biosynthesis